MAASASRSTIINQKDAEIDGLKKEIGNLDIELAGDRFDLCQRIFMKITNIVAADGI